MELGEIKKKSANRLACVDQIKAKDKNKDLSLLQRQKQKLSPVRATIVPDSSQAG